MILITFQICKIITFLLQLIKIKKKTAQFCEKKKYAEKVNDELKNDSFYIKINQNLNLTHKKFLAYKKKCKSLYSYHLNKSSHHKLSFIFMTPKFPKTPVKFRFICSINRNLNIVFQNMLRKIYGFLKCK